MARPRERQSLPPGAMFPREEPRKQGSPGPMDGPRTSLRDHGLLAVFPGPGAPTQQDLTGSGWLQSYSATAVWPEPDQCVSPPATATPGCPFESGRLLQHTVFYTTLSPLKPTHHSNVLRP